MPSSLHVAFTQYPTPPATPHSVPLSIISHTGKASVQASSIDAASSNDPRIAAGQSALNQTHSAPLPLAQMLQLQQQSEQRTSISDQASTSYLPAEGHEELWVEVGDFMCSATEMEATIDGLVSATRAFHYWDWCACACA